MADSPWSYHVDGTIRDGDGLLIATVDDPGAPDGKARGALLAAAPALVAAVELVADRCPMCAAGEECQDDDCYVVRQALAKARGDGGEQG